MTLPTFPPLVGLAFPVRRSPIMATSKSRSINGKVSALQLMSFPIWNYKLPYSFLRAVSPKREWQDLVTFFLSVGGAALPFQFHDVDDDTATAQAFGVGTGTSTDFQLVRTMSGDTGSFIEPVFVPTISEVTINGTPTVAYTESGGLITFTSPPANGAVLRWTGTYNWIARFDEDTQEFEKFADKFWRLNEITFTTEPL